MARGGVRPGYFCFEIIMSNRHIQHKSVAEFVRVHEGKTVADPLRIGLANAAAGSPTRSNG
jgi:hypothetical protein